MEQHSLCPVRYVLKKVLWRHRKSRPVFFCEVMPGLNLGGQVGIGQTSRIRKESLSRDGNGGR